MASKITFLILLCLCVVWPCVANCQRDFSAIGFDDELRIAKLEGDIAALQVELTQMRELAKMVLSTCNNTSTWTLKRTIVVFPNLEKLSLNSLTPTFVETIPLPLPTNTRAIIISIICNFWNVDGHAYLILEIQQEGNDEGGMVNVMNRHYKVYANTWYNEVFVPWDSVFSNKIVVKVTESRISGGNSNWFQVRLVGYVQA